MKKITLLILTFAVFTFTANAQFVFPPIAGPTNVVSGAPVTLDINDVANTAAVTAGQYASFTITVDWSEGLGGPYSNEADLTITTAAGSALIDPATAGAAGSGAATTLTFAGGLAGIYDPSVDGTLSITLNQSWDGSDADWSNISVTLEPFVSPTPPTTLATLNVAGCLDTDGFTAAYDASVEGIVWVEVVYDGNCTDLIVDTEGSDFDTEIGIYDANGFLIGTDDDGGTGTLSSFTAPGLAAGTYYVAAGRYNTTFAAAFGVTTSNTTQTGTMSINASTPPPPPPTVVATLTLAGCGVMDTYTNAAYDSAVDGVVWIQLDYDGACFEGTVDTEGSDFDTEIGLYDSNGLRVGNDDDGGTGLLSSFTELGLAAGTYYIAAGGYNVVFNTDDFDVTTTSAATGSLVVNASTPVIPPPPTTVATLTVAGCDDLQTYTTTPFDGAVDGVVWVELIYDGVCFELSVDTEGSDIDTEIGLYDSNGLRVGNNDDGGTGTLSLFTADALAAGTYYIAAGGYNVTFNATDFDVTSSSTATGTLVVNASTPTLNTADFCNLQFPSSGAITTGDNFDTYAQVYEAGITDLVGQGANIEAWIGYSTTDAIATTDFETGWTWVAATYNTDNGNNDEYTAEIGSGLASGTYYYASRFTVDGGPYTYGGINPGGSDGNFWDGVNYVSGELTVTDPPPPANDNCTDAIVLTPGAVFTDNPVVGTNASATDSGELPLPGCALYDPADSSGNGGDVWYAVTIPSDGNLTIETSANPIGAGGDTGMAVYSGACGALALVECDDDDSPDGFYSLVIIEPADGLADQVVYVRVWEWGGNAILNFQVSAYSATLGVDTLENEAAFTYYPNPVKNTLTLNAQNTIEQVAMYNMLGQEVLRATPNTIDSDLDMSNLQTGTYFVKVTIANVTKTIRVIKQ